MWLHVTHLGLLVACHHSFELDEQLRVMWLMTDTNPSVAHFRTSAPDRSHYISIYTYIHVCVRVRMWLWMRFIAGDKVLK